MATDNTGIRSNRSSGDFSMNIFSMSPYPPNRYDTEVTDRDKAGATLIFSGVFLSLVGITFTIMGWIRYDAVSHFEWTQLLGPILLSVGVTFVFIAVCRFRMLTCKFCKESEDRLSEADQTPYGQSFVFTGINQPITFHGATVVQYIPTTAASLAQEGITLSPACLPSQNVNQRHGSVGTIVCPPQYCAVYALDNPAFLGDENCLSYQASTTDDTRNEETEEECDGRVLADEAADNTPPPAYDDIFPASLSTDSTT
ncbi:transmembrane protein 174 [Polypterus senegalus]|uniref:transmembrane protein 174 n=1 Tax=Polypterus senegalus TaxID=55291 RepID=UPI001964CD06|nr:transmembrane protein 174 [Polypterus senegalus]